jgi:hypothetical protein
VSGMESAQASSPSLTHLGYEVTLIGLCGAWEKAQDLMLPSRSSSNERSMGEFMHCGSQSRRNHSRSTRQALCHERLQGQTRCAFRLHEPSRENEVPLEHAWDSKK